MIFAGPMSGIAVNDLDFLGWQLSASGSEL